MIAKFFIFRPIFAWVISLIIMISGVISLYILPVEQYPDIVPPQININASYSGADAQTVTTKAPTKIKETSEKAPKVADKITGEYNGKKVYTGPRGGKYYINSNGNKTYIQD